MYIRVFNVTNLKRRPFSFNYIMGLPSTLDHVRPILRGSTSLILMICENPVEQSEQCSKPCSHAGWLVGILISGLWQALSITGSIILYIHIHLVDCIHPIHSGDPQTGFEAPFWEFSVHLVTLRKAIFGRTMTPVTLVEIAPVVLP